jgi:hypothetical protein
MARITHDAQSFLIDNRRIWLIGAGIDYARVPHELWADRIVAAKQAGFNTIVAACPWLVHEPRKGRYLFAGNTDIRRFVELCTKEGLYVGLKVGPYINGGYDGGGLPSWLRESESVALREDNAAFLERASVYLRKLLTQVADLQATSQRDGGIIYIQAEDGWRCTNDHVAEVYLGEIIRHIRENGINVPIFTANGLWAEAPHAIETWTAWNRLLTNLRQLRIVFPNVPRTVTALEAAAPLAWGDSWEDARSGRDLLHHFAEGLAAGAQTVISPFHGGTNFGFLGGRKLGRPDGYLISAAAPGAPLGEAGERGEKFDLVKRLATFATRFGYVFAELDPEYHPVAVAVEQIDSGEKSPRRGGGVSVVPLRGNQGRIVFVFGDPKVPGQRSTLLLENGLILPIELGSQALGWYLMDVDLGGVGRLDYCNLCPFAIVDRSILVLFGPEKAPVHLSINESLVEATVPTGPKPRILRHQDMTLVICNEQQIDGAYVDEKRVLIGASGVDPAGNPIGRAGFAHVTIITGERETELAGVEISERPPPPIRLREWRAAPADTQASGTNPRFATLSGPETLDACGTPSGYGWYRVNIKSDASRRRLCALPHAGNRLHLFVDGEPQLIVGTGPGSSGHIFDLKLAKGEHIVTGLADHTGRFSEGNDVGRRKGWHGHLYEVRALRTTRGKVIDAEPADPFSVRSFLLGQSKGRMTSARQAVWTFNYRKKNPVIFDIVSVRAPGLFLLNDRPLAWFAGDLGETNMRLLVEPPDSEQFRRGANELRFAPDSNFEHGAEEMIKGLHVYETVENLTADSTWGFARWEPPDEDSFVPPADYAGPRRIKGRPCWWRTTFHSRPGSVPTWFSTEGLSKGQVFLNGIELGRYFTASQSGARVGPQTRLFMPPPWIRAGVENEVILFDEHGFDPSKTAIEYAWRGEMD